MADKPVTVRRKRIGSRIGRLDRRDMTRLNSALAFVLGLALGEGNARWVLERDGKYRE